jgi:hypothetical protein
MEEIGQTYQEVPSVKIINIESDDMKKIETNGHIVDSQLSLKERPKEFGLCTRCNSFVYIKRAFGTESCWCRAWPKIMLPNKNDPIITCTDYYPIGQLSLLTMADMAWDLSGIQKTPIGFKAPETSESLDPDEKNNGGNNDKS